MPTVNYDSNAPTYTEGTDAWADTIQFTDTSAIDNAYSLGRKERSLKSAMLQAYGGLYDAANSQALTTSLAALEGTAWNGSFGPTAYNTTLTATSNDGITPTVAGIYHVHFEALWHAAAATTVTFAVYSAAAIAATGAQKAVQSVTETASQYQMVSMDFMLALAADAETRIFVKDATATPTLTLKDVVFWIRRVAPSA